MDFQIYCIFLMEPEFDIKNQRPKDLHIPSFRQSLSRNLVVITKRFLPTIHRNDIGVGRLGL